MNLIIPKNYKPKLDITKIELAIKLIKDNFERDLASELRLYRVTAPLFVLKGTGINDDLTGVEKPVSFTIKDFNGYSAEIVQSLAKWKRLALADYKIKPGYGIYTDMNAIRPDETIDNLHSIYVDQWDWERVITEKERNIEFLIYIVKKIYSVMRRTEFIVYENYSHIEPILPEEIKFIHSEDLLKRYPNLTPQDRETQIVKEHRAVFIIGIGAELSDGKPHDLRAPDYDDWSTETEPGYKGLNGDIIVWHPVLERAFEISSMGIRVDKTALLRQLSLTKTEERKNLYFHKRLLNDELPLCIGGGIGQSRLCMFYLRTAHIGEVQVSIWPEEVRNTCKENNIFLL